MCFQLFLHVFQEADEVKGATSWPDYYIDQLRCLSAVSDTITTHIQIQILLNKCSTGSALLIFNVTCDPKLFYSYAVFILPNIFTEDDSADTG